MIIDWLILLVVWPTLGILPGTEGFANYRDPRWHVTNFFKGIMASGIADLLIGVIAIGVQWVGAL